MFIKFSISNRRKTFSQHVMKFIFCLCCLSVLGSAMECITSLLGLFSILFTVCRKVEIVPQREGSLKFLSYLTRLLYLSALLSFEFLRTLETKVKVIFVPQQAFWVRKSLKHEGVLLQDKMSICVSAIQHVFLVDSLILVKENVIDYELLMLTVSRDE